MSAYFEPMHMCVRVCVYVCNLHISIHIITTIYNHSHIIMYDCVRNNYRKVPSERSPFLSARKLKLYGGWIHGSRDWDLVP